MSIMHDMMPLYVALVTAVGVVLAALVNRIESNDRLNRLQKEVEILGKLREYPEARKAHTEMLAHVNGSVNSLFAWGIRRRNRMHPLYGGFWHWLLTVPMWVLLIGLWWAPLGRWHSFVALAFWVIVAIVWARILAAAAWTWYSERKKSNENELNETSSATT